MVRWTSMRSVVMATFCQLAALPARLDFDMQSKVALQCKAKAERHLQAAAPNEGSRADMNEDAGPERAGSATAGGIDEEFDPSRAAAIMQEARERALHELRAR